MKTLVNFLIVLLASSFTICVGQQIDFDAKTLLLVPQEEFLSNANWDEIFSNNSHLNVAKRLGWNLHIAYAKDGSVFVSDGYKYSISKLDKTGKVVKTFGKKGWNQGEFASNQDMHGILDNKYLVISDCQGRIHFYDLDGNFVKMITIDFGSLRIFPVKNGKLVIQGHVPYSTKTKNLFAELDFNTGQYKQVYHTFTGYQDPEYGISIINDDGSYIGISPPFSSRKEFYQTTSNGEVIIGINSSEMVKVFTPNNGNYTRSEFKLQTKSIAISQQEKDEYYENFKKKLEDRNIDESLAEKMKEPGYFPEHLPYYYNVIADDQNNCLFFMYSNKDKDHLFSAYSTDGKFLGESEFKIEGYDLLSNSIGLKIMDGYVYALALKKNDDKPLRILKCKVSSE